MSGRSGFIQIGVRALINAETLNMVESVGNVTRRRTLPIIYRKGPGNYTIRWVPAISGEALAHRYQLEIVNLAKQSIKCSDTVDFWSEKGEFLKHFSLRFYKEQCKSGSADGEWRPKPWECELASRYVSENNGSQSSLSMEDIQNIEKTIVDNSIVEDIGGFLVTEGPVRRTSRVRFSYAIPTEDTLDLAQIDHQMHVRGALQAQILGRNLGSERGIQVQIPYYVQTGAALYGFNIEIDLERIGVYTLSAKPDAEKTDDRSCDRNERRRIAIRALKPILELEFGARRSRSLPHGRVELALAVVSSKPIPLPPASLQLSSFLAETADKVRAYKDKHQVEVDVVVYVPGGNSEYISIINEKFKTKNNKGKITINPIYTYTAPEFIEKLIEVTGLAEVS